MVVRIEDCYEVGFIAKAQGIHGEVRAVFDVTDITKYVKKKRVFLLQKGGLVSFDIESNRVVNHREMVIKFKSVSSRSHAEDMAGTKIFLPLDELPKLPKGKFYMHEVIGFDIEDENLGNLGKITRMIEMPAQNLVEFIYNGNEILVPVVKHIVKGIDREKRVMYTALPEGHLEVFVQNKKDSEEE